MKTDVAVVGGGLCGALCCWTLQAQGVECVWIRGPGRPTSAVGPGLAVPAPTDHLARVVRGLGVEACLQMWDFGCRGLELLSEVCGQLQVPYSRGVLFLPSNAVEANDLAETEELLRHHGRGIMRAFAGDPSAPSRGGQSLSQARLLESGLSFSPSVLLQALCDVLPAEICIEGSMQPGIGQASGGALLLRLDQGDPVEAEIAIVCAGAASARLVPGLSGWLWPQLGQARIVAGQLPFPAVSANWGHESYQQLEAGRVLAAGFRPDPSPDDRVEEGPPDETFQGFLARFLSLRFGIEGEAEQTLAAALSVTLDNLPLIGPLPGESRLLLATGFCGRGYAFGAAAARALAALIFSGKSTIPRILNPSRLV